LRVFSVLRLAVSAVATTSQAQDLKPQFCGTSAIPKSSERYREVVKDTDEQAGFRRVEVSFVPTNGKPPSVHDEQNASSPLATNLGCPKQIQ